MKGFITTLAALFLAAVSGTSAFAQTFARSPAAGSTDSAQLQTLVKKIDEQNAKIDMLSQQILKLELQIANMRPGVMIGENTPAATPSAAAPAETTSHSGNGNTHVVARGETLTSIAKMHGVTVSELQKFNHIENPLLLRAGQTIMIPIAGAAPAAPSSSP